MQAGRRASVTGSVVVAALLVLIGADSSRAATPLGPATDIAAGPSHACAAMQGGGAQCWGGAAFQSSLALGRTTSALAAGPVEALSEPLASIVVGQAHSCAATATGRVKCWGDGAFGALGVPGVTLSMTPVEIDSLPIGVTALGAGFLHTCAVDLGGAARCWGNNTFGQLGNGLDNSTSFAPQAVTGLSAGVIAIDGGASFTCAIVAGGVKCWGANDHGQIGDGTVQRRLVPTQVATLTANATSISAGAEHACAVVGGAAKCWGRNDRGQLGDGTFAQRTAPVDVVTLSTAIVAVSAGGDHSCALRQDGVVLCWGNNDDGELGDGTFISRLVPAPVIGIGGPAVEVQASVDYTCVRRADGVVRCFGSNASNRLGIASSASRLVPAAVSGGPWAAIDAGDLHSCAIRADGSAYCFGSNAGGQLGTGGAGVHRELPTPVALLASGVAQLRAGGEHTCARTVAGAAYCWGRNHSYQLGDAMGDRAVPGLVAGLSSGIAWIDAGSTHTCAATSAGAALCWGGNDSGQVGDGSLIQRSAPTPVSGLASTVAAVVTGGAHSCALRTNGGIKCWGRNYDGQLGEGTFVQRATPVDVLGLNVGATDVSAGLAHSCAVASGRVLCWGDNDEGQLGDGTNVDRPVPVEVIGLSGAIAVASGGRHTCAIAAGGGVRCWGSNYAGQIGPNAPFSSRLPVDVPLPAPAEAITAGHEHSCARLASGTAMCWGVSDGRLGTGDTLRSPFPRDVLAGTFTTTIAAGSTPNPSDDNDLVTLSAVVSNADVMPEGSVIFLDGENPICSAMQNVYTRASCTVHLTTGVHRITARYASHNGLLPVELTFQHVVHPVAGQHCSGFDDVDAAHPLCRDVDWVRNRSITLGCTELAYCPADVVGRLTMAAFMNRFGRVFSPEVIVRTDTFFSLFVGGFFPHCLTNPLAAADHPRRVYVDAIATGVATAVGPAVIEAQATAVRNFSSFTHGPPTRTSAIPGQATTLRAGGTFDVPAETATFQFGITLSPVSQPPVPTTLDGGGCVVRIIVVNRDETHAPFDTQP